MASVFPPFDIRLQCGEVTLRLPRDEELERLALSSRGRIVPAGSPFLSWASTSSPDYERRFLAHHWRARAEMEPDAWSLHFGVFLDGTRDPIGFQSLTATDFQLMKSVGSGSWLLRDYQARGIGTLMRTMVLELAFIHFEALEARTCAHVDNQASNGVSRRVGYEPNGRRLMREGDQAVEVEDYRLLASDWVAHPEVKISGVEQTILMLDVLGPWPLMEP